MEKTLGWATLAAVLFFLVVTVAMLSGVPVSEGGRSWIVEGVPNWMQGLGTLAAAYFAWKAFSTWREQDAERRKVVRAEELLAQCHKAVSDIRRLRRTMFVHQDTEESFDDFVEKLKAKERLEKFYEGGQNVEALRAHRPFIKAYFQGDFWDEIIELEKLRMEIKAALGWVELFGLSEAILDEVWEGCAESHDLQAVETLGVRFVRAGRDGDAFEDKLTACIRKIDDTLIPIIAGKEA